MDHDTPRSTIESERRLLKARLSAPFMMATLELYWPRHKGTPYRQEAKLQREPANYPGIFVRLSNLRLRRNIRDCGDRSCTNRIERVI